jgi:hypothetical protein
MVQLTRGPGGFRVLSSCGSISRSFKAASAMSRVKGAQPSSSSSHCSSEMSGAVVWASLGPLPRWVPGPIIGGPLGLLDLGHTTPDGVGRKNYNGGVLG